ncbi:MAG TPA: M28 family peptidase [Armatimonadota bacterium]
MTKAPREAVPVGKGRKGLGMGKVAILLVLAVSAAAVVPALQRAREAANGQLDGRKAFTILQSQCDLGPRPPGTAAHLATRNYLMTELRKVTDTAETQAFAGTYNGKPIQMWNLVGTLNPDAKRKIMLCAHWDTRPTADEEALPEDRQKPILGANDGASGVAVLLELARVLKLKRPQVGIIFCLLDGEDVGPGVSNMFLGASYYAKHPIPSKPERAILIDMIGDSDLRIPQEPYSLNNDREMVQTVWKAAKTLGFSQQFPEETQTPVLDDHTKLQDGGIPSIDLIDFTYPAWHTLQDTPDRCSARSLETVGKVLEKVARELKP